jgi:cholest-4-en-3-one 26-monooxygenase
MAVTADQPIDTIDLGELSLWVDGPPHAIFERLRKEDPVHWSPMATWPGEPGFWSITRAEDLHAVTRDWQTFSSERGGILAADNAVPIEFQNAMFIGMDPPRHDRIKALFQRGFTPKRIADHADTIKAITNSVLDSIEDRESVDLITEVAQPIVGRVIGRFLGVPEEDDPLYADIAMRAIAFGDEELQPEGSDKVVEEIIGIFVPKVLELAAERRANPTDDLTSVLVHAEIDGERLEDHEIVFGFALLVTAGNDSTKATYSNGMLALLRDRAQMQSLIDDPEKIPTAVEEFLRMFPAFGHFRRTATRDVELGGKLIKEGDKVIMWYPSSNRDESLYECPHKLDVERGADHQAFGAGGRHTCLGMALARLELATMFTETLRRFPDMELIEEPQAVRALFMNQPRSVRVRLRPAA